MQFCTSLNTLVRILLLADFLSETGNSEYRAHQSVEIAEKACHYA